MWILETIWIESMGVWLKEKLRERIWIHGSQSDIKLTTGYCASNCRIIFYLIFKIVIWFVIVQLFHYMSFLVGKLMLILIFLFVKIVVNNVLRILLHLKLVLRVELSILFFLKCEYIQQLLLHFLIYLNFIIILHNFYLF